MQFVHQHYPGFECTNVFVNKNTVCKMHTDAKNVGLTLLVGVGAYTGGETVLVLDGKEAEFDISMHSLVFNGATICHRSKEFEGTRYSLVFY